MYCQIESTHEGGDKSSESLLMGLSTLKVATRNFSEENKLGEGGFGPVYKVLGYLQCICYLFPFLSCRLNALSVLLYTPV